MTAVSPLNWFCEDPRIGYALNYTYTPYTSAAQATNAEYPGALGPGNLGEVCQGSYNSRWVYVQASTTVTAGNIVYISPQFKANNFGTSANALSVVLPTSLATSNLQLGVAQFTNGTPNTILSTLTQVTANTNDYFWACLEAEAGLQINTSGSVTAGTVIYAANNTAGGVAVTGSTSVLMLLNLYCNTGGTLSTWGTSQSTNDFYTIGRIRTSTSV